jgi:DNA-binding MarR family transcriptional regulator
MLANHHLSAWRMFLRLHAQLIQHIDKRLAEAGCIPLNWYDVLIELYTLPNRRLRMSDLAERVVLTRSGLTRLVDRLEEAGYIVREQDPQDKRGFFIVLQASGIEAMREAWKVYEPAIQELFAQHLSEAEVVQLGELLGKVLEGISLV